MCDDETLRRMRSTPKMTRRGFAAIIASASAVAGTTAYGQAKVVEKNVDVKTADGVSDSALFYPEGRGTWPAVVVWPDIMVLRPVFREMGRRLASQGYVVLVVNPFYRSAKAADIVAANYNFGTPEGRAKLVGFRAAITDAANDSDAVAYVAFLDAQPQTNKAKKVGVQGYCMGGALSVRTAAAVPNRIGVVGSFHGGNGLVSAEPTSPHLLIEKTNARFLFAAAKNDDATAPTVKNGLREAMYKAGKGGIVDVYQANHGWCVPDSAQYNQAEAERAWSTLSDMYKVGLV